MSWKQFFGVIAVMALLMVSFRVTIRYLKPVTAVEMGMNPDKVTHVMGAPLKTSQKDELIVYTYPKAQIYFKSSKVVGIVTDIK